MMLGGDWGGGGDREQARGAERMPQLSGHDPGSPGDAQGGDAPRDAGDAPTKSNMTMTTKEDSLQISDKAPIQNQIPGCSIVSFGVTLISTTSSYTKQTHHQFCDKKTKQKRHRPKDFVTKKHLRIDQMSGLTNGVTRKKIKADRLLQGATKIPDVSTI